MTRADECSSSTRPSGGGATSNYRTQLDCIFFASISSETQCTHAYMTIGVTTVRGPVSESESVRSFPRG